MIQRSSWCGSGSRSLFEGRSCRNLRRSGRVAAGASDGRSGLLPRSARRRSSKACEISALISNAGRDLRAWRSAADLHQRRALELLSRSAHTWQTATIAQAAACTCGDDQARRAHAVALASLPQLCCKRWMRLPAGAGAARAQWATPLHRPATGDRSAVFRFVHRAFPMDVVFIACTIGSSVHRQGTSDRRAAIRRDPGPCAVR